MTPHVVDGDLLDQDVDVLVNAWNRKFIPWWLLLPQGVSGAIKRRAGAAPFREVARVGTIPLGGAVVTGAGRLQHKAIIHVAGIDALWRASARSIGAAVQSAMALVDARGDRSVAFPLIGSGSGGFAASAALAVMIDALQPIRSPAQVVIVRHAA